LSPTRWPPWLTAPAFAEACADAPEETMAPMAAAAAATRNNEQKIRRQRDGVNMDIAFRFEFVIIALPVR